MLRTIHGPEAMELLLLLFLFAVNLSFSGAHINGYGEQPLAKIQILKTSISLHSNALVTARPVVLGLNGQDTEWVNVRLIYAYPSVDDWVGVFSPARFDSSTCPPVNDPEVEMPFICSAPIKYKFANYSNPNYIETGQAFLRFQLINQRADFSFALFSGGLSNPKLVAISNSISFVNPKAPLYPRLALGKSWDEMTVTWTSGYNISEATPFVEWGMAGDVKVQSPAGTLDFQTEQHVWCTSKNCWMA